MANDELSIPPACEPDGLTPTEFHTIGPTRKTLSQCRAVGWKLIEVYK